eukprot:COSAG01_NODE_22303_length_861_cov_3.788714_2_plen_36_part_01
MHGASIGGGDGDGDDSFLAGDSFAAFNVGSTIAEED